jgi:hypothetical protein
MTFYLDFEIENRDVTAPDPVSTSGLVASPFDVQGSAAPQAS